jgi:hypothetical protein
LGNYVYSNGSYRGFSFRRGFSGAGVGFSRAFRLPCGSQLLSLSEPEGTMSRPCVAWIACIGLLTFASAASADGPAKLSVAELSALIDRMLDAKIADAKAVSAPLTDDADFYRRLSLDLRGRVGRVSEVRAFLSEDGSEKRAKAIEEMLASTPHVTHMSTFWRQTLIPANNNNQAFQFQNPQFNIWIDERVRDNVPFDKVVRDLLVGPTNPQPFRGGFGGTVNQNFGSQVFYAANENKPENIASSVSRIFLGVRLECAQCHDHPFASWKRKQFWEMAAFFTQVQPRQPRVLNGKVVQPEPAKQREIKIPNTDQTATARFMDGKEPDWKGDPNPQMLLADWVVSPSNPYFAKTAVNRLWAQFFGLGLAEPVDDETTEENPVSHPELLDELTKQFVASGFDVRHMIRAIVSTKAYQRSSLQTDPSQADPRLLARMSVRGMSAEQLFDSLTVSVGFKMTPQQQQQFQFGFNGPRADFLNRFASTDKKTEKQTSILQALSMMNGKFVNDATSIASGTTLGAVSDATFMTNAQKIETLYLAALGRLPRPEESVRALSYIERGGARNESSAAFSDLFWVLLNSSEFVLNR